MNAESSIAHACNLLVKVAPLSSANLLSKNGPSQRRPRSAGPGPTEALASLILGQ